MSANIACLETFVLNILKNPSPEKIASDINISELDACSLCNQELLLSVRNQDAIITETMVLRAFNPIISHLPLYPNYAEQKKVNIKRLREDDKKKEPPNVIRTYHNFGRDLKKRLKRRIKKLSLLLVLLSFTGISTAYVIRNTSLVESYYTYPTHHFELSVRGNTADLKRVCLHWINGNQEEVEHDCSLKTHGTSSMTSPYYAAGYKFSFHLDSTTIHAGPYFWWDGWIGMAYCNDLKMIYKIIYTELKFNVTNHEYPEYFAKTRSHEWRENNFILWLEANGENLFARSRPLQERKMKWHTQFLNSLEAVISLCKSFLEDSAHIITTDDRSNVKSTINKATPLIKNLMGIFISPLMSMGMNATAEQSSGFKASLSRETFDQLVVSANGENLFARSRSLQERKMKWHNQFLNSLEAVISLCKSFLEDSAHIITTDDRSNVKSTINKATPLIKNLMGIFISPLMSMGMNATAEQSSGFKASLSRETFDQLVVSGRLGNVAENKVPDDVSQWWVQRELGTLKNVEWTSAWNEETQKRLREVDALDEMIRNTLERQQIPENQTYSSFLSSKQIKPQKLSDDKEQLSELDDDCNFIDHERLREVDALDEMIRNTLERQQIPENQTYSSFLSSKQIKPQKLSDDKEQLSELDDDCNFIDHEELRNLSLDNASIRITLLDILFQCRSKDLELEKTIMNSNFLNDIIDTTDANFCNHFTKDNCDHVQVPSFVRKSFVVGRFDPFLHEGHDIAQRIMTHLYVSDWKPQSTESNTSILNNSNNSDSNSNKNGTNNDSSDQINWSLDSLVSGNDNNFSQDSGKIVECDHQYVLLQNEDSIFRGMYERSGEFVELLEVSSGKYRNDNNDKK
ncbi:hypothetical protein Glove_368g29 [Diversispora epigaea]|uniref:Uncharacterized protein n=1 Tax=Diversispora epigaea TaxID=1348612 RepID=A0A397H9Z7_9GLOM|nr:hypothetical protein Glove_368g29 [Diversispora epigaea]